MLVQMTHFVLKALFQPAQRPNLGGRLATSRQHQTGREWRLKNGMVASVGLCLALDPIRIGLK